MAISNKLPYEWLMKDPPALFHAADDKICIGEYLPARPVARFVKFTWHQNARWLEYYYQKEKATRPGDSIHLMLNSPEQVSVPHSVINSNAFLDERIFTPSNVRKDYDAIYTARATAFKRHSLAKRIPRLLLVMKFIKDAGSMEYYSQIQREMPSAVITDPVKYSSAQSVASLINSAKVGLALSPVEGAMYASTEYLLCGIPVVSTPSLGGRDLWYDESVSLVVDADEKSIADAVASLSEKSLDPASIRGRTLRVMYEHRARFFDLVEHYTGVNDFERQFYQRFYNKCISWRPVERIGELYDAAAM